MSFWAVVETEAQREHMARLLIMRLGYETYLPRIKHRSRITPLFPRYLFVRIIDRWYPVRWTPHVLRILMPGDCPAPDAKLENSLMLIRKQERAGLVKLPTATQFCSRKASKSASPAEASPARSEFMRACRARTESAFCSTCWGKQCRSILPARTLHL